MEGHGTAAGSRGMGNRGIFTGLNNEIVPRQVSVESARHWDRIRAAFVGPAPAPIPEDAVIGNRELRSTISGAGDC